MRRVVSICGRGRKFVLNVAAIGYGGMDLWRGIFMNWGKFFFCLYAVIVVRIVVV